MIAILNNLYKGTLDHIDFETGKNMSLEIYRYRNRKSESLY